MNFRIDKLRKKVRGEGGEGWGLALQGEAGARPGGKAQLGEKALVAY
jgi:hypothetical protein